MGQLDIKTFTLGSFSTNAYLIINKETAHCVLVDAPQGIESVQSFIEKQGYKLLYVIVTHGHIDHIEGLSLLECSFYIHEQEKDFLQNPSLNLSSLFAPFIINKPPSLITEKFSLPFDSYNFEILHTPGHTPGSISVKLDSYLFSGDTLFFDSVGRTDFPYASSQQLFVSLRDKIIPLHKDALIFPGHGPSTNLKREIENNPFLAECKHI